MELKTESVKITAGTGTLTIPVCTSTERDALTAATGMICINSTTGELNIYDGTAWRAVNHD
jgi:hypothetical protein